MATRLLIPCNMLKTDEDVFLDDFTVRQVSDALQVPIDIVKIKRTGFYRCGDRRKTDRSGLQNRKIDLKGKII